MRIAAVQRRLLSERSARTRPTYFSSSTSRSHFTYAEGPGHYGAAAAQLESVWKARDFRHRGFTVGIGGPVGSGKTATVLALCRALRDSDCHLAVVTNDIFTQEDAEFLQRSGALPPHRIRAVETGGCPHAAIREDVSANLTALEELTKQHYATRAITGTVSTAADHTRANDVLLLCESGGDNLAANFSRELADLTLYVIDVAGGDKVPRKGGPGITQSDLLIINKTDLAEAVGADLDVMQRDADRMRRRQGSSKSSSGELLLPGPTLFCAVKHGKGVPEICDFILRNFRAAMSLHHHHDHHEH